MTTPASIGRLLRGRAPVVVAAVSAAVMANYRKRLRGDADRLRALSEELSSTERQLQVILGSVDAAVTVRSTDGRMVYANQAAADLLKLANPESVMAQPPGGLMERFDVYTEDGDPVDLADLPAPGCWPGERSPDADGRSQRRQGDRRGAVAAEQGHRGHGSRWSRSCMAVNLIEDITETKRSEIAQRLLARSARALAEAPMCPATLQAIADAAVPSLADWAGVIMVEPSGADPDAGDRPPGPGEGPPGLVPAQRLAGRAPTSRKDWRR